MVEDLRIETRFNVPKVLIDHGVRSGVSVIVQNADPYTYFENVTMVMWPWGPVVTSSVKATCNFCNKGEYQATATSANHGTQSCEKCPEHADCVTIPGVLVPLPGYFCVDEEERDGGSRSASSALKNIATGPSKISSTHPHSPCIETRTGLLCASCIHSWLPC